MQLFARWFVFLAFTSLALATNAAERTTYFVPDAQGSPVAAMDEQGSVLWRESYAPYGERRIKAAANDGSVVYTGKSEDASTGLIYMGARWYDPEAARFTGIDPAGFQEGNPQSFGRYVYANASPYRYTDPNGESPIDVVFLAYDAAAFAGAVGTGNPAAMWSSGADLAASFLGVVSPVPGTGQAIKALKAADAVKDTKRVFWSGGEKAKSAAESYAKENGKRTLEMTGSAKWLMEAQKKGMTREESGQAWGVLSKNWADGAGGEVDVFLNRSMSRKDSVWATVEKPALMQDPNVTRINYFDVK